MCPVPKDNAHPMTAGHQATKEWEHGNGPAQSLLSTRLADKTLLRICHHKTAKVRWDTLIKWFGNPGNPNVNTPEGVAPMELDSMPGEDTTTNLYAPTYLEGAGPELSMDGKEDHSLEVEEEGIARDNASIDIPASSCKALGSAPLPHKRKLGRSPHHHHPSPLRLLAHSAHRSSTQGHRPPQNQTWTIRPRRPSVPKCRAQRMKKPLTGLDLKAGWSRRRNGMPCHSQTTVSLSKSVELWIVRSSGCLSCTRMSRVFRDLGG